MKRKLKQILAGAGIVLLVGMYLTTIVCAIIDTPIAHDLLRASISATFVVPFLLYGIMLVAKLLEKNEE